MCGLPVPGKVDFVFVMVENYCCVRAGAYELAEGEIGASKCKKNLYINFSTPLFMLVVVRNSYNSSY